MTERSPIDKRSPKEFWDDQHKTLATDQYVWIEAAYELTRAFDILVKEYKENMSPSGIEASLYPDISKSAIFLGALAIENLLKAIRLKQLPSPFNEQGEFILKTHKLYKLASDASIIMTVEDNVRLERLEEFITWVGRYPIPLSSESLRPRTLPGGGYAPLAGYAIPQEFADISSLIERLKTMLPNISYVTINKE